MTQQEIADRLGLSSPYIAQMESGFKPPPPEAIVEKMSKILRLSPNDCRRFGESAEAERELQSLVKATRKVGYILAGNKVCVPQKTVSYRTQNEIDELVGGIPEDVTFHIDLSRVNSRNWDAMDTHPALKTADDLRSWSLSELGDQPSVWLAFLGCLYEVLILTPDDRLLCRNPKPRRQSIAKYGRDVGVLFQNLHLTIEDAIALAGEQKLPEVIAPHEAWKQIDELLGSGDDQGGERIPRHANNHSIRTIQIVATIPAGIESLEPKAGLGTIGLPGAWFNHGSKYEACLVESDAYVSLGVWPGCKAIFEVDGDVLNEDLVVVFINDRLYFRRYFDMGGSMLLQGGPLSKPIQVKKDQPEIRITGVVRELIARFRDMK